MAKKSKKKVSAYKARKPSKRPLRGKQAGGSVRYKRGDK